MIDKDFNILLLKILNDDLNYTTIDDTEVSGRAFQDQLTEILQFSLSSVKESELSPVISNCIQMIYSLKKNQPQNTENQSQSIIILLCLFFALKTNSLTKEFLGTYFSVYIPFEVHQAEDYILQKYKEKISEIQFILQNVFNVSGVDPEIIESAVLNLLSSCSSESASSSSALITDTLRSQQDAKPEYEKVITELLSNGKWKLTVSGVQMNFVNFLLFMLDSIITIGKKEKCLTIEEYCYISALQVIAERLKVTLGDNADVEKKLIIAYLCIYFRLCEKISQADLIVRNSFDVLKIQIILQVKQQFLENFKNIFEKIHDSVQNIKAVLQVAYELIDPNTFDEFIGDVIMAINSGTAVSTQMTSTTSAKPNINSTLSTSGSSSYRMAELVNAFGMINMGSSALQTQNTTIASTSTTSSTSTPKPSSS